MEAAVRRHLATWLAESADFASPESPIRRRLELLVLDAWITVFLGVDPRTDVTLHGAWSSSSRGTTLSSLNARTHKTWSSSSRSFSERSLHPDELSASALRALAERVPEALDDPVVTSNLVHMIDTSRHDVTGLVTWLVYRLAHHHQWCDRIRQADRGRRARVLGCFRDNSPVPSEFVLREAQCPVTLEGYTIPAGWWLRVLVREATATQTYSPIPSDSTRAGSVRGMPPRSEYSPFGLDAHACIGEALTRTFATVVARELSFGCRLEPTADGPAIFTEHYHWAPSPEFRVRFTRGDPVGPDRDTDREPDAMAADVETSHGGR